MTAAIDITAGQRKTLLALLRQFIPGIAVWAYGSRVKWTARPNSDLDLVAFTTPAQNPLVSELKEAFAESNLPFLVDFHVWDEVPERFHEIIRKEYVVLQEAKQLESGSGKEGKWPIVTLEDVCETITDGAHLSPKDCPSGLPMASVKDMNRWGIDVKSSRTISQEDFGGLVRNGCQPKIGDVLIAKDGATCLDTVCEFKQPDKIVLLSSIAILRPSRQLHSGYLRYYLDSADTRAMLKAGYVSGSAIPRVVLKDFRRAPIVLPPLADQKTIAHILGTLDDKIELNRRTNATLEAMARALFQSWFVDFDPVRAKLDGRKPAGLDAATAALFPAHFQDSPLGHIPQGWEVKTVGDIGNVVCGKTPSTAVSDYYGNDIPFITIPDMHGNVFAASTGRKLSRAGADSQANKTLPPGSICVSCIATPGLVVITSENSQTNQQINSVVPHQCDESYFWYWVMTGLGAEIASSGSGGSVLANLSKGRFETLQVINPPHVLIRAYHSSVRPLFENILANTQQSRTLATIRDALLPKLLSGELNVVKVTFELESVT